MARRWPVFVGLGLSLAALGIGLLIEPDRIEGWHFAARWTARVGLPVFLAVYLASSLVRLWPAGWNRALLRDRRWWGLGFAASHTVHLVALVTYLQISGTPRTIGSLIPGGIAYALLFAMALTSSDAAMRALGRNWKRLHTLGIHYIWFIFFISSVGRILDPAKRLPGVIEVALTLAALAVRLAARRKTRAGA
jgi:DMSO/TMAO reductase YedYZ heme-binding membrane subunit